MKETTIWAVLHLLIAVLFLIKFWIFYTSKDGVVRKAFIAFSLVMAYYFISITAFRNLNMSYDISMILASTPVLAILIVALYLLRHYAERHLEETEKVKHELEETKPTKTGKKKK